MDLACQQSAAFLERCEVDHEIGKCLLPIFQLPRVLEVVRVMRIGMALKKFGERDTSFSAPRALLTFRRPIVSAKHRADTTNCLYFPSVSANLQL